MNTTKVTNLFFIAFLLISCQSISNNKPPRESSNTTLPKNLVSAIKRSGMIMGDSGKPLTDEFINQCVKERYTNYIKLECDDLVYPYSIKLFKSDSRGYALIVNDMGSVQSDIIFQLKQDYAVEEQYRISGVVTQNLVIKWMNKKFPTQKFSIKQLRRSAHSPFWIELNNKSNNEIIILSGEMGDPKYSFKPIGKVQWTGKGYQLLSK